jgi:hypothetical protein
MIGINSRVRNKYRKKKSTHEKYLIDLINISYYSNKLSVFIIEVPVCTVIIKTNSRQLKSV